MTYQGTLEGAVQMEQLHVDDAPRAGKPQRHASDYIAPVVGFAGFVGFYRELGPSFAHEVVGRRIRHAIRRGDSIPEAPWLERLALTHAV